MWLHNATPDKLCLWDLSLLRLLQVLEWSLVLEESKASIYSQAVGFLEGLTSVHHMASPTHLTLTLESPLLPSLSSLCSPYLFQMRRLWNRAPLIPQGLSPWPVFVYTLRVGCLTGQGAW